MNHLYTDVWRPDETRCCMRLYQAVINRALCDLLSKDKKCQAKIEKDYAHRMFRSKRWLEFVCDNAGYDVAWVLEIYQRCVTISGGSKCQVLRFEGIR